MIREARITDYDRIQSICELDLGYVCEKEMVKMRLANIDHNRECVFVADEGSKVIGFIHVEIYEILYAPSMANILGIAVSSEYRKQGIATKLLELIIDEIKYKGCKFARLHASSEGKKLYEKIGFVEAEGFMSKKL